MNQEKIKTIHKDLVDKLTDDLKPVKPTQPKKSFVLWLLVSSSLVAAVAYFMGLRPDLSTELAKPLFGGTSFLLIAVALLSAWIAIRLSTPGNQLSRTTQVLLTSIPLILIIVVSMNAILQQGWSHYIQGLSGGLACASLTLAVALIPLILLAVISSRMAPLYPFTTSVFISLAAFSLASVSVLWHCSSSQACHLSVWHFAPIFFGSLLISYPLQLIVARWKNVE